MQDTDSRLLSPFLLLASTLCPARDLVAAPPVPLGPLIDFNTFPTSALTSYIEHYNLAPAYPPPPAPRASSHSSSSGSEDEEDDEEEEDGEAGADGEGADGRTEEEILAEASGKRRAALASAAATSTSYGPRSERFRARSPPATTTNTNGNGASGSRKRTAAQAHNAHGEKTGTDGEAGGAGEEDEECPDRFFDDEDAKSYLSAIAQKHFAGQPQPKEGEVVVGFLYRCRTKGELQGTPTSAWLAGNALTTSTLVFVPAPSSSSDKALKIA